MLRTSVRWALKGPVGLAAVIPGVDHLFSLLGQSLHHLARRRISHSPYIRAEIVDPFLIFLDLSPDGDLDLLFDVVYVGFSDRGAGLSNRGADDLGKAVDRS